MTHKKLEDLEKFRFRMNIADIIVASRKNQALQRLRWEGSEYKKVRVGNTLAAIPLNVIDTLVKEGFLQFEPYETEKEVGGSALAEGEYIVSKSLEEYLISITNAVIASDIPNVQS